NAAADADQEEAARPTPPSPKLTRSLRREERSDWAMAVILPRTVPTASHIKMLASSAAMAG
ncbi:MAG: hypothetical protein JWO81_483, partial [Alphaproteobacteria bacterium]|nr:hypothetical protein [Alphaproteobacteria bacterium]